MAGKGDKAAAFLKDGGAKAKATGAKIYSIAKDPSTQEKAKRLIDQGKKVYQAVTSPEAQRAYRRVAETIKKARKK